MHTKKYEIWGCCFIILLLFINETHAIKREKTQEQKPSDIQVIVDIVKKAINTKNFKLLEIYVTNKKSLYWAPCGPHDIEPEKLSFDSLVQRLLERARGADIYVHEEPDVYLWDFEEPFHYSVNIYTDGWTSEYPYLSFGFEFRISDGHWYFSGVCDSVGPPLVISKDGTKYKEVYYREPQLPRPGPKIFKNQGALEARIKEIIKFRAFDALQPYAIKKTLIFGQCSRDMMLKDTVQGKMKPVSEVIKFLKEAAEGAKEIKRSGFSHITYYETTGWSGEYPFMTFWVAEGKTGWEWTGVTYCKISGTEVLFPDEPRFK